MWEKRADTGQEKQDAKANVGREKKENHKRRNESHAREIGVWKRDWEDEWEKVEAVNEMRERLTARRDGVNGFWSSQKKKQN